MKLYNTLTRDIQEFKPLDAPCVGLYTCGPTVYNYVHIGNLRKYIGDDILKRVLKINGYEVKHIMNVTDVGHLVSDADEGEDKIEKMAREKRMEPIDLARFFEAYFFKSTDVVNVQRPDVVARVTEHIKEQVELIEKLLGKGFAYITDQAIYFDVAKFPEYTKLSGQKLEEKEIGVRKEVVVDPGKRNPADFALWFKACGRFANHIMRWSSPWGEGFPGWHIECSAIAMTYLGETLDIHTGGIDHVPVHHTNEIAQSEAASGKEFVKYWVHHGWLLVDGEKMSKSKKNFYTIDDVVKKGFDALAYRYLTLLTHYRAPINFTWKGLESAQSALDRLYEIASALPEEAEGVSVDYGHSFLDAVNNDLNMPEAISVMWELLRSKESEKIKAATLYEMDQVFGLKIREHAQASKNIPEEIMQLVKQREILRKQKKFGLADQLRNKIEKMGYILKDDKKGTKVLKKI
ncbi:cysteine--tRNA ligase [Candidatus Parcubacteria bacterium]|nr:MAG: cysteine--tRNA ligase [Candidatus Parcubacteria bacterium]